LLVNAAGAFGALVTIEVAELRGLRRRAVRIFGKRKLKFYLFSIGQFVEG
jgi:hypothetical protein